MTTQQKILEYLRKSGPASGTKISSVFGITRQAAHKHLKKLLESGQLVKEGRTKGASYSVATSKHEKGIEKAYSRNYSIAQLQEDAVFQEFITVLNLKRNLNQNALEIIRYTFTEILNNAIEHSRSKKCTVSIDLDRYRLRFRIKDFGIGIFYSIYRKFRLKDEHHALLQLLKGKTTTMPAQHSGEGVFFTSRAGDFVSFRSHRTTLIFDNLQKDVFVEEKKFIKGTEVEFRISRLSRKRLDKLFAEFAPEEFEYRFEKTRVLVRLLSSQYVSRSEARRLLQGLDKFQEIVLDFKGVKSIGQAFSDEIFRVFLNQNPEKLIRIENLSPVIEPIIHRVVDNKINSRLTIS